MGLFDKFKKILFDEEIEEVTTGEELPERTPKKNYRSESGFIDHSADKEEDVIKEVVYSPNPVEEEPVSRVSKYETEEYERKENIPRQISRYEDTKPYMAKEEEKVEEKVELPRREEVETTHKYDFGADFDIPSIEEPIIRKEEQFVQTDKYGLRRDYKAILRNETEVRHGELEHKDYAAIVRESHESVPGKKPFVVTPVISPVYGILDKNYTPDSVIEKNKDNSDLASQKKRLFGKEEPVLKKEEVKEEIIEEKEITKEDEYFDSIQNIIDEDIPKRAVKPIEEAIDDTEEYQAIEPTVTYEEPVEEIEETPIEEDPITPDKNDIPTSNEEYYEEPEGIDDYEAPSVSIDTLIDNPLDDDDDEDLSKAELDDTIETDLFNLIDSMYNRDEEEN